MDRNEAKTVLASEPLAVSDQGRYEQLLALSKGSDIYRSETALIVASAKLMQAHLRQHGALNYDDIQKFDALAIQATDTNAGRSQSLSKLLLADFMGCWRHAGDYTAALIGHEIDILEKTREHCLVNSSRRGDGVSPRDNELVVTSTTAIKVLREQNAILASLFRKYHVEITAAGKKPNEPIASTDRLKVTLAPQI